MSVVRNWYIRHQDAVSWFIIGLLTANLVDLLSQRQYGWAAFSAVMIYLNYKFSKVRLQ